MSTISTGVQLIASERHRQIHEEHFTPEQDQNYVHGELTGAALAYIQGDGEYWPLTWSKEHFKLTPDNRVRELTKAGALIAAEIDRLQGR